jgi:hypothetical protein
MDDRRRTLFFPASRQHRKQCDDREALEYHVASAQILRQLGYSKMHLRQCDLQGPGDLFLRSMYEKEFNE